ncbi:hydroxymethylglutaryl-CoA reductase [Sphingorhabdus arenilitoris]|uniref:hydroxymethylglutaryl-CoA reductase (NADPH) n=1 Tax=Sphingorhabdus arenilitoris TaxID=1490041 RepID=A0ABV8RLQ7_9SPHN
MTLLPDNVHRMLASLRQQLAEHGFVGRMGPSDAPPPQRMPTRQSASDKSVEAIWQRLQGDTQVSDADKGELADSLSISRASEYAANIENYIGTTKLPLGVIGPLRVNGLHAAGDYFVPMATSEAALVASYARGAEICSRAGGVSAAVLREGVLRTPAFIFPDMLTAGHFINWIAENEDALQAAAQATTRHGKLIQIEPFMDVDLVFLMCRYTTGDAAGQNMVTVATQALCNYIAEHCPIKPLHWFVEANFSGDKKASYLGMHSGRGRKVTASVTLPDDMIRKYLRADPDAMMAYGRVAGLGSILSGQMGAQAHYANALAAIYIATGQDAACVAESSVGFTRMERRDGGIFFSVTLPNILVGTVGGGTGLPSQSAGLAIMGLKGAGHAPALAEVIASACMCGEISIVAAIAAGHFTHAHHKLARLR